MSSGNKEKAKTIVEENLKLRRDKQFAILLQWKNGEISGRECIEAIEDLSKIIEVSREQVLRKK